MTHAHLADILDLDAEVLHEYHRDVITWVAAAAPGLPRVVDLGAGTGTGSFALARHLPAAEITAVDVDEAMLQRLRHRAGELGVAHRIRTVQADLDRDWPDLGPVDLVWASASMHHLGDPAHGLGQAFAALRPGGLIAITELDAFPRFLTDPAEAALEDRCRAALAVLRAEAGLHMHEDWAARLGAAGFTVEAHRRFDIALRPPLPAATGRYAQAYLGRMRHGLDGRIGADDLAALETLAAGVADRDDLVVDNHREAWIARRP